MVSDASNWNKEFDSAYEIDVSIPAELTLEVILTSISEEPPEESVLTPVMIPLRWPPIDVVVPTPTATPLNAVVTPNPIFAPKLPALVVVIPRV